MKRCVYCNQDKGEDEFSEEHVLPQAIGGNLSPTNPFKTSDVCARCNNFCGLFIDAPFIKSWFTQSGIAEEARRYVEFSEESIFPLRYMGPMPDLTHKSRICEFWIGPTGDSIYHFHEPYPEVKDMPIIVGPAPNLRSEIDKGFAFIYVVPSNPVWWKPILRSFAIQFQGSALYLGNGQCPSGGLFSDIPEELVALHGTLNGIREDQHHVQIAITIGYEARFLAKLALGLGHLFLDPSFISSDEAQLLRDMMWERSSKAREGIPVRGSGFLGEGNAALGDLISWPTGHLVGLLPIGQDLTLYTRFYNHQTSVIKVTGEPKHWKNVIPDTGIVFAVNPGLRSFFGPMSAREFIAHQQGVATISGLTKLAERASQTSPLPPVHLPG